MLFFAEFLQLPPVFLVIYLLTFSDIKVKKRIQSVKFLANYFTKKVKLIHLTFSKL